jgi:hypothetical protein
MFRTPCRHGAADPTGADGPAGRLTRRAYRCYHCGVVGPAADSYGEALDAFRAALNPRALDRSAGERYRGKLAARRSRENLRRERAGAS